MAVLTDDIRQEVKRCLDRINDKRKTRLSLSNDTRAQAMGLYFDENGVLRKRKTTVDALLTAKTRTNWPVHLIP